MTLPPYFILFYILSLFSQLDGTHAYLIIIRFVARVDARVVNLVVDHVDARAIALAQQN